MKDKIITILGLILLAGGIFWAVNPPKSEAGVMTSDELSQLLENDEKVVILDVREENEYNEEHIPGAILFPKSKFDKNDEFTEDILKSIRKSTKIVAYCGAGHRSGWVAKKLAERGYRDVSNLDGISFWKKQYETIKGPKESNIEPLRIQTAEAKYMFDSFSDVFWVDVRDIGEYNDGHIKGAVNIPLTEIEGRLAEFPRDKDVVLYCSGTFGGGSCSASLSAARIIIKNGLSYGKVKVYEEGYQTWESFGYPVEK